VLFFCCEVAVVPDIIFGIKELNRYVDLEKYFYEGQREKAKFNSPFQQFCLCLSVTPDLNK